MPNARHAHRAGRSRAVEPRTSGPQASPLPCIVGGLLAGQPEHALLLKATAGAARVELVDERLALLSAVLAFRPGALVLPPFDVQRTSTAPLVLRARREAPAVTVVVLAAHPAGAGQPLLRAVQAGATVLTAPTAEQLRGALLTILVEGPASREEG